MKRILLTGMSGVGKSAALRRLASEGILCVDLDDGWMRDADGEPMIDLPRVRSLIQAHPNDPIAFAGCAVNQGELDVDCTVLLTAPPQVMRERIATRENPFGKDAATWAKILSDKAEFEPALRAACDIEIDTRQPLERTVARVKELLEVDGFNQRGDRRAPAFTDAEVGGRRMPEGDIGKMTYEEAVAAIPPGRYRHFKGNEYEVLHIARHSETEAPLVVYRALYGDFGVWVRPADMWNETVVRDGRSFKRFERVEPMNGVIVDGEKVGPQGVPEGGDMHEDQGSVFHDDRQQPG